VTGGNGVQQILGVRIVGFLDLLDNSRHRDKRGSEGEANNPYEGKGPVISKEAC